MKFKPGISRAVMVGVSLAALSMGGAAYAQSDPTVPDPRPQSPAPTPAADDCGPGFNNCSIIEQSGSGNTINLSQTGNGNTSNIEQEDSNRDATVTQSGDNNTSDVDQLGIFAGGNTGSEVTVNQTGTNADSYILQDQTGLSNFQTDARVTQAGDGASSIVRQIGSRNTTTRVDQEGDHDSYVEHSGVTIDSQANVRQRGTEGNNAIVFQFTGTSRVGPNATDGINQDGEFNNAEVYQLTGRSNQARVSQEGDRNDGIIVQNKDNSGAMSARARSFGDDNEIFINQSGTGGTGRAFGFMVNVGQNGSDNVARVSQNNASTGATTSFVRVDQDDDGNDAFVDQDAGIGEINIVQTSFDSSGMVAGTDRLNVFDSAPMMDVNDSIRANFARVYQRGTGLNQADINQTGFGNRSDSRQDNDLATAADVDVLQNGLGHDSFISQTTDATADVDQGGLSNLSIVEQGASGSGAFIDQIGAFNESQVTQSTGMGHTANVDQRGETGFSGIEQSGTSNTANLTQNLSADSVISLILQDGTSNSATVTQSGTGDFSLVSQTGTGNMATVNQP